MNGPQKRSTQRYSCTGKVKVVTADLKHTLTGRLHDLSLKGCLLELDPYRSFEIDSGIEIVIDTHLASLRVKAVIRRVPPNQGPLGVRFDVMTERGRNQLKAFIEELDDEEKAKP